MDIENFEKLRQKVLNLIPPGDRRKLHVKLKNTSYTDFIAISMAWINKYSEKYEKRYYNLAKIILFETEPPVLNSNAYKEQEEEFIKAKNHNLDEFNEITIHYLKKINNLFPFDKIMGSLLIMMAMTEEFADSPQNISFFEFQKKVLESFLYKIIDQDNEQFDIFFFDWNLKFGYIIEGYLKEMLCMKLMIKNLLGNKDNTILLQETPTIGNIIRILGEDMDQGNIRNAIFHSDFFLEYEVNWDERLVTFKNKSSEPLEVSIKEFISLFFETIQIVLTFGFALEYVHFLKITEGNEEVLKYIKQESVISSDYLKILIRTHKKPKK